MPSGVRTITGVATSITAFVGRAAAGPTDEPTMLTSFADYERQFGGLDVASPMSYSVRDFYLNGGSMALDRARGAQRCQRRDDHAAWRRRQPGRRPVLEASSPGAWGNRLAAAVDYDTDRALPRTSPPATNPQRFNLTVRYRVRPGKDDFVTETFGSVSTNEAIRASCRSCSSASRRYVRVTGTMPADAAAVRTSPSPARSAPSPGSMPIAGSGSDGSADRRRRRDRRRRTPKTGIYALNRADLFNLLCIPPPARDTRSLPSN